MVRWRLNLVERGEVVHESLSPELRALAEMFQIDGDRLRLSDGTKFDNTPIPATDPPTHPQVGGASTGAGWVTIDLSSYFPTGTVGPKRVLLYVVLASSNACSVSIKDAAADGSGNEWMRLYRSGTYTTSQIAAYTDASLNVYAKVFDDATIGAFIYLINVWY